MNRKALTLIELLVGIAIVSILAALTLGIATHAMSIARTSRTKATLNKIDGLLTEQLATYETRRVEPHPDYLVSIGYSFSEPARGMALADVRLLATREMLKYEMPDRWSDVTDAPVVLNAPPSVSLYYRGRYNKLVDNTELRNRYQSAECLYLIVMYLTGDGEARTLFREDEIADTDGDGAKEFVDGWGQPIGWMRWPANFAPPEGHDPLDVYRRDLAGSTGPTNYQFPPGHTEFVNVHGVMAAHLPYLRDGVTAPHIRPIVYSSGPDGISDVNVGADNISQGLNPNNDLTAFGSTGDTDGNGTDNSRDNLYSGEQ